MKRMLVFLVCLLMLLTVACKPGSAVLGVAYTPEITPTPVPTPTPDPLDAIFAEEGDEIVLYKKDGVTIDPYEENAPFPDYWLYNTHDLRIEINQVVDEETPQVYYIADIRTRNSMREKAAFGSMKPPGHSRNKPGKLARLYSAVLAINGDYLVYNEKNLKGILIRDGKVYNEGDKEDTLAFFPDMSLRVFEPGEITAQELLDQGVVNAYSFGPTLVNNGVIVEDMKNVRRINNPPNPRCGIGMIEPGHLVAIVVEGRINRSRGLSMEEFAGLFIQQGCTVAYNFDGGASASIVFLGNMCNSTRNDGVDYLGPRPLVDMITFGESQYCPGVDDPYYNSGQIKTKSTSTTSSPASSSAPDPTP